MLPPGGWGDRLTSARELTSFAEEHGLVALNTWSGQFPGTYLHQRGHSQIDFLFARKGAGDGVARRCVPKEVPIGGWREMDHRAFDASVRIVTHHMLVSTPKSAVSRDVRALSAAVRLDPSGAVSGRGLANSFRLLTTSVQMT